jgi:hypothetical protein
MSQRILSQVTNKEAADRNWNRFYKLAAAAALLAVLVALADITLTFFPAGAEQPGTMTAVDWFELFETNWFFGLRNLGLLPNILTLCLLIPVYMALYTTHRNTNQTQAALALILCLLGTGIYLSNNAAFPMLALSAKYAAATTDAHRSLLVAAGEAILARGEDFTPGVFMGFLFGEVAMITISFVLLRGGIFSRATAFAGILGGIFLTVFTIWTTFIPVLFEIAMLLAMLGGLISIAWYILIARRLFQIARGLPPAEAGQAASLLLDNA